LLGVKSLSFFRVPTLVIARHFAKWRGNPRNFRPIFVFYCRKLRKSNENNMDYEPHKAILPLAALLRPCKTRDLDEHHLFYPRYFAKWLAMVEAEQNKK
jgi:hypothetical protein